MASSFDVHLEDSRSCVSCKLTVGRWSFHMGSAFIAMVEMFHSLHSLWVSLFPFLVLWWNVMLCATCTKYFSWNWSRLWSRRHLYSNIMQNTGPFAETLKAEESIIVCASCADDAWHAEKSISSFYQHGSCAAVLPRQDPHSGVSIHVFRHHQGGVDGQRGSSRQQYSNVGIFIRAFCHKSGLCKHDAFVDVATPCTDEWGPHPLNQVEELDACESTAFDCPTEGTRSYMSKLSSLSLLDGRGPQQSGIFRPSHWAAFASLLPHQVPLLDVHDRSQNPLEYLWLQLSLCRNLLIEVPMLINAILGELSCAPALICGKEYPDLAWHFMQFLKTRGTNYTTFQLVLPTNITNTISLSVAVRGAMEDVEFRNRDLLSSSSFHGDVGEDGPQCVQDVGGIYGRPEGDTDDGFYDGDSDFDDNAEDYGDGFSDWGFFDDDGPCGNSLERMELHVVHTWWDEDAVLVDKKEGEEEEEEESMEQAWQVV